MLLTSSNRVWKATKEMMEKNFSVFCQALMPPEWFDEKFHVELCDFLQHAGKRKLIILPRTHLKTTLCATFYALWRASVNTNLRVLEVSNTAPNAEKTVRGIRSLVEQNSLYQAFFPECVPNFSKTRWSDRCACLARREDYPEGTFEAAGVNTNIIRRHFNLIIEDDTVAPRKDDLSGEECMPSREDVEQAIGFHKLTPPLLIDEHDEQIVIGTRWASYDHINYIKEHEKYAVFDKPALSPDGVPLYKRFSHERLESIRISMGTYLFSALYMNSPLAKEFMTFNPDWLTYFEENEVPEEGFGVVTFDPADPPTGKKNQNYSAIVSCWHSKIGTYVKRYFRGRVTDKQGIAKCFEFAALDHSSRIRVEVDRYAHLEYAFKEEMQRNKQWLTIEAVKTRGYNKEARIRQRLQPLFENRIIYLRRGMRELEEELAQFPNGALDDLIDALAWQVEGIYPTQAVTMPVRTHRRLPTFDEMLDTLRVRGKAGRYPFNMSMS